MADPTDWGAYVEENAPKYGVDPKLARSVMQVESSGNPAARSSAGAMGLMQLMPDTAKRFGVDPTDPYQNIHGGLSLLSELTKQHRGDRNKILAAYNGGKRGLTDPLPETQKYIPKVTALMDQGDDVTDQIMGGGRSAAQLPQVPQPPVNAITGTPEPPSLTGFGKNVLTSGGQFLGNTAQGMWDLTKGIAKTGYELYEAPDKGKYLQDLGMSAIEKAPGVAKNIGRYAKERYGGVTPTLHTLYTDPVGAAADVSTLAGGGEFAAGKMLGKASGVTRALGTVSAATDPFSAARIPARVGKSEKLMTEALKPTEQVLKRDPQIVKKALKYDTGASKAGLAENRGKIQTLLGELDKSWDTLTQTGKEAQLGDIVTSPHMDKLYQDYKSVNPTPDYNAINEAVSNHVNFYGQAALSIPADEARSIISNTYKRRASTYEGRAASVTAETEQTLAKSILDIFQKHEEQLAQTGVLAKPVMKQAGAELSDRIRLEGVINRAVNQELKLHTFLPAAGGFSGGILAAMLGHPGFAATAITLGMARTIMRRPDVQSALAHFWSKGHSLAGAGLTTVGTVDRATRDKNSPIPQPPTAGMGNPSDVSLTIRSDGTDDVSDQMK